MQYTCTKVEEDFKKYANNDREMEDRERERQIEASSTDTHHLNPGSIPSICHMLSRGGKVIRHNRRTTLV